MLSLFKTRRKRSLKLSFPLPKFKKTRLFKKKRGGKKNLLAQTGKLLTGLALVNTGMSLRKRVKVGPVTLNLSKQGISTTIGTNTRTPFLPQLSVNIGKKGTYLNISLVGTGAYKRIKLDKVKYSQSQIKEQNIEQEVEQVQVQVKEKEQRNFFQKYSSSPLLSEEKDLFRPENFSPSKDLSQQTEYSSQQTELPPDLTPVQPFDPKETPWYDIIPKGKVFYSPAGLTINRIKDYRPSSEYKYFCPHCESTEVGRPNQGITKLLEIMGFFFILVVTLMINFSAGFWAGIPFFLLIFFLRNNYKCKNCQKDIKEEDMMIVYKTEK